MTDAVAGRPRTLGLPFLTSLLVSMGLLAGILYLTLGGSTPSRGHPSSAAALARQMAAISACQSDARTVDIAVQAFTIENPLVTPDSHHAWRGDLLSAANNGPFLRAWPSQAEGYSIAVGVADDRTPLASSDGSVAIDAGDVLVDVTSPNGRRGWYDFTQDGERACNNL